MMIFMEHKVYNMRQKYPKISICQAIGKVCKAQEEPERIISFLDVVDADITDDISEEVQEEASVPNKRVDSVDVEDTTSKFAVQDLNMLNLSMGLSSSKHSSELRSMDLSGFDLSYDSSSNRK
jgi:hypothetical protein